jgi:drug/metabolite transporter (DMT)-like permease
MTMSQNDIQGLQSSGESHKLSIGLIIGATIGLIGLILLLYGLFGNADYSRSDHININLWWGLLMLVFGIIMALGGYIASRRRPALLPQDAHDAMVKP